MCTTALTKGLAACCHAVGSGCNQAASYAVTVLQHSCVNYSRWMSWRAQVQLAEKDGQLLELSAQLQATQQQLLRAQRAAVSPPRRSNSPRRCHDGPAPLLERSPLGGSMDHKHGAPSPLQGTPGRQPTPFRDISNLREGYLTASPSKQVNQGISSAGLAAGAPLGQNFSIRSDWSLAIFSGCSSSGAILGADLACLHPQKPCR